MTIELLTIFLGWTTVINILVLIFSALVLLTAREKISKLHARLFGVDQANISQLYFQYLAQYKIIESMRILNTRSQDHSISISDATLSYCSSRTIPGFRPNHDQDSDTISKID